MLQMVSTDKARTYVIVEDSTSTKARCGGTVSLNVAKLRSYTVRSARRNSSKRRTLKLIAHYNTAWPYKLYVPL